MCTGLVIAFQCVIHSNPTINKDIDKRKYNKRKARQAQQHELIVASLTTMAVERKRKTVMYKLTLTSQAALLSLQRRQPVPVVFGSEASL